MKFIISASLLILVVLPHMIRPDSCDVLDLKEVKDMASELRMNDRSLEASHMLAQKSCSKNEDCDSSECCIDTDSTYQKGGLCSAYTKKGELCNPHQVGQVLDMYQFSCPCLKGLTCQEKEETWGTAHYVVNQCLP